MKQLVLQVLQSLLEIAIILLTPYAIKALKALEVKAIAVAGANNYSFGKEFIKDIIKAKADVFSEDELVELLDELDNKLGNKLTRDEIKQIVDSVLADLQKEVKKEDTTVINEEVK